MLTIEAAALLSFARSTGCGGVGFFFPTQAMEFSVGSRAEKENSIGPHQIPTTHTQSNFCCHTRCVEICSSQLHWTRTRGWFSVFRDVQLCVQLLQPTQASDGLGQGTGH